MTPFSLRGFSLVIACTVAMGAQLPAAAQAGDGVTVLIGDAAGSAGHTVEVPVDLQTGILAPVTMVLWFGYDPDRLTPVQDYYEQVLRDGSGAPLPGENGAAAFTRSGVRADFSLEDTEKSLMVVYHPEAAAIAVSIVGLGTQTAIPEGPLLTLAFRVADGVSGGELAVVGHDEANPVTVAEVERRSSASDEAGSIAVDMRDGSVQAPCFPPDLPTGVAASAGRSDGVLVTWDAGAPLVQYRVYRAETDDVASALPLGEGWQTEMSFLDLTAVPGHVQPSTCAPAPEMPGPTYYYWVASRYPTGCEQNPAGAGVTGSRGAAKTMAAAGLAGGLALLALAALARRRSA